MKNDLPILTSSLLKTNNKRTSCGQVYNNSVAELTINLQVKKF